MKALMALVLVFSLVFCTSSYAEEGDGIDWEALMATPELTEEEMQPEVIGDTIANIITDSIGEDDQVVYTALEDRTIYIDLIIAKSDMFSDLDMAATRTSSVTDTLLEYAQLDSMWDYIQISFEGVGLIVLDAQDITTNDYGGRYFPMVDFVFQ